MIYKVRRIVDGLVECIDEIDEKEIKLLAKIKTDLEIVKNLIPDQKYLEIRELITDLNVHITKILFNTAKDPQKNIALIVDMIRCLNDMCKLSYA